MAAVSAHSGGVEEGFGVSEIGHRCRNTGSADEKRANLNRMKNITFSADENVIEQARLVAQSRHTTLDAAFREWLEQYAAPRGSAAALDALMRQLQHVNSSGPYTQAEMNER